MHTVCYRCIEVRIEISAKECFTLVFETSSYNAEVKNA
jgi:hypothetical protein